MYDWQANAESTQADQIPAGVHDVEISKIIYGNDRGAFETRDGDPGMMLVFADAEGREASQFCTLSHKAGWVLARIMGKCDPPINLEKMREANVEPIHFQNEKFARNQLIGRRLHIRVSWPPEAKYPVVVPVDAPAKPGEGEPTEALPAADEDNIPF